jgi:hypothetical protein
MGSGIASQELEKARKTWTLTRAMSESNLSIPAGAELDSANSKLAPGEARADVVVTGRALLSPSSRAKDMLKWAFSFPAMLGTFLVGKMFYSGRMFFVDPDLWWHIKTGQDILATHQFPTTDPYSFTVHGQPWIAYEWLGEVVTAYVEKIGGVRGLEIYLIALGSVILIALYYLGTLRSGNSKAGFVAAGLLSSWAIASFTLRPQMLGYLFLVLTVICLVFFRQGKRKALWALPLIMLAWVNAHGSFIIGLGAIFVYWMGGLVGFQKRGICARRWSPQERRDISFAFLLCLAVLPITPYGTRLALYPFDMAFSQPINLANIKEWQSMSFGVLGGKTFLAFVLGFFVLQMIFEFEWRLEEFSLFLCGTVMAFLHIRFVMLFVPFSVPLFGTMFARWLPPYARRKDKYVLNGILMAGVVAAMIHYFPSRFDVQQKVADKFPVKAVEHLRAHPVEGPMYNTYYFGGYLVWSGYQTFIDGRADVFERGGVLGDYIRVARLEPGALSVLGEYRFRACLVERDEPISIVLLASPEWKRVYVDNVSALYVRQGAWNSSSRN